LWHYHIKVNFIVQFEEEVSCGLENICKLKIIEHEKSFEQPSIDNINVFHKMKTTTMFKKYQCLPKNENNNNVQNCQTSLPAA